MEIKIVKKEDGEIIFEYDGKENQFDYENFDELIERVYDNDDEIIYNTSEELKEYEELLKGIIDGARTEDYREAVKKAKEAKEKLEKAENETINNENNNDIP